MKLETNVVIIPCFCFVGSGKIKSKFHFSEHDVLYHYKIQFVSCNGLHMVQSFLQNARRSIMYFLVSAL